MSGNLKESLLETIKEPSSVTSLKKIQLVLVIAVIACNAVAVCLNLSVSIPLGSECNVYVVGKRTTKFPSTSDYNSKNLVNFVAEGSIPKWINPTWRIPSVNIIDAKGTSRYVQGDAVTNQKDDQYNVAGSSATKSMVDKLKGVDVSSLQFPVNMNWIQIEGADAARILKIHLAFVLLILVLLGVMVNLKLKKGLEFIAMYIAVGGFMSFWFGAAMGTCVEAFRHPPTAAMIQEIPESFREQVVQPCHAPTFAADTTSALGWELLVQAICLVLLGPVGKMLAEKRNDQSEKC